MKKRSFFLNTCVALMAYSTVSTATPASTEHVKASIDTLRNEFSLQINTLNLSVSTTQKQISELSNTTTQLNRKTSELANTVNELMVRLNALNNKMNDSDVNTTNKIEVVQNKLNELPILTHHLGEIFQGGVVFYIDSSQQHGLMVSLDDLEDRVEWRNGEDGDRITNAKSQGLGSGEMNTRLIIAEQTIDQQEGRFAALIAANYQISADGKSPCSTTMNPILICYGGWYLPSLYELVLLRNALPGEFKEELYWSSTEQDTTQAWLVDFTSGESQLREKSTTARIRAIHAF